jgi:hypothetical protein
MAKKKPTDSETEPATIRTLADLVPDDRNANKGTERGSGLIESSLRQFGAGRSVLADKHGRLIAGNKTVEGAASAGIERLRVVQTTGHEIVVVQRMDLDLTKDKAARELAIADNRAGQVSLEWDAEQLTALATDYATDLSAIGFSEDELAKLGGKLPEDSDGVGGGVGGIEDKYEVVIACTGEDHQREIFERLTAEGLTCRVLTL